MTVYRAPGLFITPSSILPVSSPSESILEPHLGFINFPRYTFIKQPITSVRQEARRIEVVVFPIVIHTDSTVMNTGSDGLMLITGDSVVEFSLRITSVRVVSVGFFVHV